MWTREFRKDYARIIRLRRLKMKRMGGIMKVAAYFLSDKNIYDDEIYDYLNSLYIESELGGPCSLFQSNLDTRRLQIKFKGAI